MSFIANFKSSPILRPSLNLGCLFDIPTGTYLKGEHGENILNGGLSYITAIGGRGNTYKSTIAHYMTLIALDRYIQSEGLIYDTEISLTRDRLTHLSSKMERLPHEDFFEESSRLKLTDKTQVTGNKWFESFRNGVKERIKNKDKITKLTPFVDKSNKLIPAIVPVIAELDSLSQFDTESIDLMYDKNEIGASGLNTESLKAMAAKSQMLGQLPALTGGGGVYTILTAHLGDEHQLDPYAPPSKKLSFLKGKVKFKRVPENFTFLTNNCYISASATVLVNQTTKAPEFPRDSTDDMKGDTDLMVVTLQNLRAKSGPTGMPFDVVVSQSDGVQVGLSEFFYLRTFDRYGIGGHDRSYYLELAPEINLQRTTVRGKISSEPTLQRALEITSEMCQIRNLWHHFPKDLLCTPKELYDDLKALGYDWNVILTKTRGYWMYKEDEAKTEKQFLSTKDLLEMRVGKYHPYWWDTVVGPLKGAPGNV